MEAGAARVRLARLFGSRRRILIAAAVVLLVGLRIALPSILRGQIESRAGDFIAGRLTVGDVDLALLRGAVVLEDVALHDEKASEGEPPLVAWRRFWVNLGWLSLPWKTIRIEDVGLEAPEAHLSRLPDGTFALPRLREQPSAEPEPAPAPEISSKPWAVVIDRATLGEGTLGFLDRVADPPERRDVALPRIALTRVRLQPDPESPGAGSFQLGVGDGSIRIRTRLSARPDGFAVALWTKLLRVPLDRAHMHVPELGWTSSRGRLDGSLVLRLDPQGGPRTTGQLAISDLSIEVPGEDEPALAWRRLEVDVERFSVFRQTAFLRRVGLEGARVLVRPRATPPLPAMPRAAKSPSAEPSPEPAAPSEPAPETEAKPWTWRLGTLEVTDSSAKVFLEPPPLEIGIPKVVVAGLSSAPDAQATLDVEVREGEGALGLTGTARLTPPGGRVSVRFDRLALERLVAVTGAAPVRLPGGALEGTLDIEAEHDPLRCSGQLALVGLRAEPVEGKDFGLGWERLDLTLRSIEVPGVIGTIAAPPTTPLRADVELIQLTAPTVTLTRTPEGIVLPGAQPASQEPAPPAGAPAPAAPAAAAVPPPQVSLERFAIERGEVSVLDRSVKPFFRGRIAPIQLDLRGVRHPENTFERVTLTTKLPGNGALSVRSTGGKKLQVNAELERLPIPQFNPYVTPVGYSVSRGALSVRSTAKMEGGRYESETKLVVTDLSVGGARGESLFQERFGVPLSVALGLLRDLQGRISFSVPITGDQEKGMKIDLLSVVGQALARAIIGALASPLKLLGAVTTDGNRIAAVAPEPISFVPGRPEVAADSWWRVAQVAGALGSLPGLRLTLSGSAGPEDVRALQEAQVLAELDADRGAGGALRNLASGGDRRAVRDALAARAAGKPAELSADEQAKLDEWAAKKQIADTALQDLAAARAERLRTLLGTDYGVGVERLVVAEPIVDREQAKPEVAVGLGS